MQFSTSELSTIRISALAWAARCEAEAKQMDEFSRDESLTPEARSKAKANARAMRQFETKARALAERVRIERRA